jgi:hypothetical protein
MVLDEKGRITEHGPFQKISESSEYVKNLVAQPAALPTTRAPEVELSDETLEELELPDEDEDKTRQTGDCTVYGYYFRAVGGVLMSLLIFSCAAFVFDITFPGKSSWCPSITGRSILLSISRRGLAANVDEV